MKKHMHTTGPWTTCGHDLEGKPRLTAVMDQWGKRICGADVMDRGRAENEANAALIAAAPDMLKVCEMVEKLTGSGEMYWNVLTAAREAIAKVEGRRT